jgi:hypothetical protein
MVLKTFSVDYKLAYILVRAQQEVRNFQKISFYQVMRENNQQVDSLANEATSLKVGVLRINGSTSHQVIP